MVKYKETECCAECGKTLTIFDKTHYAYKRHKVKGKKGTQYYCSWSCFRQEEIRKGIDRNGKKEECY